MNPFFWLLLIPVLLLLNLYIRRSRPHNEGTDPGTMNRQDYLQAIRQCERFDPNGYRGSAKQQILQFQTRADELIHEWLEPGAVESEMILKTETFLSENADFSTQLKERIRSYQTLQSQYESKIEEINVFFSENNFYPPDFTFLANTLHEKYTDLKELKRTDPFTSQEEFNQFLDLISSQIEIFKSTHEKVSVAIQHFETVKATLPEGKHVAMLELKQKMFFALHQGDFKEAEKWILRFYDKLQ